MIHELKLNSDAMAIIIEALENRMLETTMAPSSFPTLWIKIQAI